MKRSSPGRSEGRTSQGQRSIRNKAEKTGVCNDYFLCYKSSTWSQHVKIIAQVSKVKSTSPAPPDYHTSPN